MAKRRRGRDVNGILLLDKPVGISSNKALQSVKRLFDASKAGHTGNLDPLATGLLPICFGEATKISAFLLGADKRYIAKCKLGVKTSTADAEGEVIATREVPVFSTKQLESVLQNYLGEIEQLPPMFSAIKHQGQPLYRLARRGQTVERKTRTVRIDALRLLSFQADQLELDVSCSKGTYIRTLVEDLGEDLGCGAHITALRRVGAQPFDASDLVTLPQLAQLAEQGCQALDRFLLPIDAALPNWPKLTLSAELGGFIKQGQAVLVPNAPTEGLLKLYIRSDQGETFFAVGRVLPDGRVGPKRLLIS